MKEDQSKIEKSSFGKLGDGTPVYLFTLTNKNGVEIKITTYGGIVTSVKVPDKNGNIEEVVLGFDSLAEYTDNVYQEENPFFGALIGRFGNRIAKGKFSLEGKEYQLAVNNPPNHLHGGEKGFFKVLWEGEAFKENSEVGVKLRYLSPDMEEGYPGNLSVEVVYNLTNKNELNIRYRASTDKTTIINLTHHSYFNLCGGVKRDVLNHQLKLNASSFVPINEVQIPKGGLREVEGSPFDFTSPTVVGKRIEEKDEQLENGKGYDHCWVLDGPEGELKPAATVYEPESGRILEVLTTEPGIQFYSGNFLSGRLKSSKGAAFQKRYGLCLETQHFPDSPNQPDFPSVVLEPGQEYQSETIYRFSVR